MSADIFWLIGLMSTDIDNADYLKMPDIQSTATTMYYELQFMRRLLTHKTTGLDCIGLG